jgi:hypothetical protein
VETESARVIRSLDRRRLAAITAPAMMAVLVVAVLLSSCTTGAHPSVTRPTAQVASATPPYYVTIILANYLDPVTAPQAVVRDSATGKVTGTVPFPAVSLSSQDVLVTAAANDRSFIIAADNGSRTVRLFRFSVSAKGRPGPLTELPEAPTAGALGLTGMALSPDGTRLAISLEENALPSNDIEAVPCGGLEVIDLGRGSTRSWSSCHDDFYYPGAPSWVDGNQMIAFSWWHVLSAASTNGVLTGIRLLDSATPGASLLNSQLTPVATVDDAIASAMISSDGHTLVASACRDVAAATRHAGTVTAQITKLSAQSGRLRVAGVLRAQSARYSDQAREVVLNSSCGVLAVDPSGHHVLVRGLQFGRTDNGVFTALPGIGGNALQVAAAWG